MLGDDRYAATRSRFLISNQVGGNDSLIFDGIVVRHQLPTASLLAEAASFAKTSSWRKAPPPPAAFLPTPKLARDEETEAAYGALVLGTRDYMRKTGFRKALIALSGGIDSALVAAIAVDALGAENVIGIGMPSQYSSTGSIDDSRKLAANLGIRFEILPISRSLFGEFVHTLRAGLSPGPSPTLTEENICNRASAAR
jgi:NAD+ synthase (glutamine-hydrolysing)